MTCTFSMRISYLLYLRCTHNAMSLEQGDSVANGPECPTTSSPAPQIPMSKKQDETRRARLTTREG